mgnify:FL=1
MTHRPHPSRLALLALVATLALAAAALADSIILSGNLELPNVRIKDLRGDVLIYDAGGRETSRSIDRIVRIKLADDPAFTAAEEQFASGNWAKAAEGYQRSIRTSARPWVKKWAGVRLLEAANKSGRFDGAVDAFIAMAATDPASAAHIKLTMPAASSPLLPDAIAKVNQALARPTSVEHRKVLLGLKMQLGMARQDQKVADEALADLEKIAPNDPLVKHAAVLRKWAEIRASAKAGEHKKVLDLIEAMAPEISEPEQLTEAMMLIADSHAALAANRQEWMDSALAYMRVSADFPNTPAAGDALLKTAAIHEKHLADATGAAALYRQVAQEFKGQPAGQAAARELERIRSGKR